jgi:5-(carboxyamino)imidazole ribonucleotide synthase
VHIYGKQKTKSFRKMGHVTVGNKDIEQAKKTAREVQSILKVKA